MLTVKTRSDIKLPTFDSRDLATVGGDALLEHLFESITTSTDPATGARLPLSAKAAAKPGRSGGRGYDTGELADELLRRAPTGSRRVASIKIVPPRSRLVFLNAEKARGYTYLTADGAAGEAVAAAVGGALDDLLESGAVGVDRGSRKGGA